VIDHLIVLQQFYNKTANQIITTTYKTIQSPKYQTTQQTKMPSFINSIESLIAGIFNTITAALGSILAVFQGIFNAILGVISTAFAAVGTAVSGLAETFAGLTKFLLSNIVVIGSLVGAFFLYSLYQQRNGRPVTAAPAGTKKAN